jgi:hypothetical protein
LHCLEDFIAERLKLGFEVKQGDIHRDLVYTHDQELLSHYCAIHTTGR